VAACRRRCAAASACLWSSAFGRPECSADIASRAACSRSGAAQLTFGMMSSKPALNAVASNGNPAGQHYSRASCCPPDAPACGACRCASGSSSCAWSAGAWCSGARPTSWHGSRRSSSAPCSMASCPAAHAPRRWLRYGRTATCRSSKPAQSGRLTNGCEAVEPTWSLAPIVARRSGFFFQRRFCARLIFARVSSGSLRPLFQGGLRSLLGCPANTCGRCASCKSRVLLHYADVPFDHQKHTPPLLACGNHALTSASSVATADSGPDCGLELGAAAAVALLLPLPL
jgi:hypothetical protein